MLNLVVALQRAFANTFTFYIKAHSAHWNVVGPNFPQYHALFDTIYSEVYSSVDSFAEHIRASGAFVESSFDKLLSNSTISSGFTDTSSEGMLKELLESNSLLLEDLAVANRLANEVDEYGVANFLADRYDAHKKHAWQLKATLRAAP